jgi:hypothetical protein
VNEPNARQSKKSDKHGGIYVKWLRLNGALGALVRTIRCFLIVTKTTVKEMRYFFYIFLALNPIKKSESVGFACVIEVMALYAQSIATYVAFILLEKMDPVSNIQTLYPQ